MQNFQQLRFFSYKDVKRDQNCPLIKLIKSRVPLSLQEKLRLKNSLAPMLWNKQSSEKKKSIRLHKISYSFSFIFISVNSQNVRTIGGFWCHFPVFGPASKVLILLKFRVTMGIRRMDVETFCPIISLTYKLSVIITVTLIRRIGVVEIFSVHCQSFAISSGASVKLGMSGISCTSA